MAVATSSEKIRSMIQVTQYDFDPDSTSAVDVSWVDMSSSSGILVGFFRTVGTSDLVFKILANSSSSGSGTDVEIKVATLTGVQPNAVGDYTWLECTAEEISQAAVSAGIADVRYVSANLQFSTGTDEGVVTYARKPLREYTGLTANLIS